MGGASPPKSTDSTTKPTQVKDQTSPLSPGQSQGITGASAGGANPAAAAAAAAGKGAQIKIDVSKDAKDATKANDGNPLFSITKDPKMPVINVTTSIVGVTTGVDPTPTTKFSWTATVEYDSKNTLNGVSSGKCTFKGAPAKDTTRKIPAIEKKGESTGGAIVVTFDQIRGGSLKIVVTAQVGGNDLKAETKGWRIQGSNPDMSAVNAELGNDVLRRITCLESQKKQFVASDGEGGAMYPQFSGDGCLGVGICQLTNPQPTDDQIWDWKENVKAGIALYNDIKDTAKSYPDLVSKSPNFLKLVQEYKDDLKKKPAPAAGAAPGPQAGAPPAPAGATAPAGAPAAPPNPPKEIEVKVPDFTNDQLEDDTIRGFNGWAGDDGFTKDPKRGKPWLHEFRIKRDANKKLSVDGDPTSGSVNAVWERVPASDRPNVGDQDYVSDMKKYNPTTCVKSK